MSVNVINAIMGKLQEMLYISKASYRNTNRVAYTTKATQEEGIFLQEDFTNDILAGMNNNAFTIAGIMGTNFVANIIVGGGIGYMLDYYLHMKWLFFAFLILGIISGMVTLYRDTKRLIAKDKEDSKEQK